MKRAAMEDSHAKKRPALANLSSNVPVKRAPSRMQNKPEKKTGRDVQNENKAVESSSSVVNPTAVASLERKTAESLYISESAQAASSSQSDVSVDEESYTDIDSQVKDPQMCAVYAKDIYSNLRVLELKKRPIANYMEAVQQDINASMRGILVDWLVEVAEEYKLVPDTLYLTINYIDRFLSANVVHRQRLQLLGVSCMHIAAKYEEICAPQVEEFCYITDNTYTKEEVLAMERQILNHLKFELCTPTVKTFVRRFMRAAQASHKTPSFQLEFLGNYLAELCLVDYSFLKYKSSMVAASAVFLAKMTHEPGMKPWTSTLMHYSGYKASELANCVREIYDLQRNVKNCQLPAVREKYKQHKFKGVANMEPAELSMEFFDDA